MSAKMMAAITYGLVFAGLTAAYAVGRLDQSRHEEKIFRAVCSAAAYLVIAEREASNPINER